MRRHIKELLAPYTRTDINDAIQVYWDRRMAKAHVLSDEGGNVIEIRLAPVRSAISYATALHEIGHIRGRHQRSRNMMARERWAWEWARCNVLSWTPSMERTAVKSLAWYASRQKRH
jgi:hypothetical protein